MIGSSSDLDRLLACQGGPALPQIRRSSALSQDGDARHATYEAAAVVGDREALPESVQALLDDDMQLFAELAVAYDVATGRGRRLGEGMRRQYGELGPHEVPGTIDLLAVSPSRLVVIDYKGFRPLDATAQVTLYAAAVVDLFDRDEVETVIAPEMGRPIRVTLDRLEIDAFGQRLKALGPAIDAQRAKVAAGGQPDVNEGPHCRYCPAYDSCPAKVLLLQRMVRGDESNTFEMLTPLNEATAPVAYERMREMEVMMKRVRAVVEGYARETPIRLRDGRVYGAHKKLGNEVLDGDIVHQVVKEQHGQGIADAAVERYASKKQLNEALRLAGLGKIAPAEKAVLDEVRKRKGASRKESAPVEEYTPALAAETEAA